MIVVQPPRVAMLRQVQMMIHPQEVGLVGLVVVQESPLDQVNLEQTVPLVQHVEVPCDDPFVSCLGDSAGQHH